MLITLWKIKELTQCRLRLGRAQQSWTNRPNGFQISRTKEIFDNTVTKFNKTS